VIPSAKALKREREKLKEMTGPSQCYLPLPELMEDLNRQLDGWANYFRFGYPRKAFREINWYLRYRLKQHLRRRSQRPFRPPEGSTYYDHLDKIGLRSL
jgi:RNA-directed DNA polymerase